MILQHEEPPHADDPADCPFIAIIRARHQSFYLREGVGDKWKGLYSPEGRAFPKITVQSTNLATRQHGSNALVNGSSAGASVFAAMIANLNAARVSKGLPRLGFLNPWIYGEAWDAFTDITEGGSRGCTGITTTGNPTAYIPYASWNATKGWDPVTGFGTPIWLKLLYYATRAAPSLSGKEATEGDLTAMDSVVKDPYTFTTFAQSGPWQDGTVINVESNSQGDGPWNPIHPRPSAGMPHYLNGNGFCGRIAKC